MKINGVNRITEIYNTQMNKTNKVKKGLGKDKLELSKVAKDFNYAKEVGKKIPDIRMDKIKEIKNTIASNSYNIKGKEIAEKLLESGFDVRI